MFRIIFALMLTSILPKASANLKVDAFESLLNEDIPAFRMVEDCRGEAQSRTYYPLTFRSAEDRLRFASTESLLGKYTPNPICFLHLPPQSGNAFLTVVAYLNQVCGPRTNAIRGPAYHDACRFHRVYRRYALAVAKLHRNDSSIHLAPGNSPVDLRAGNFEDSFDFDQAHDNVTRVKSLLLFEVALEYLLKDVSKWIQAIPDQTERSHIQAARAAAAMWRGHPALSYRALLRTTSCGERAGPLSLDLCRIRTDVLALVLKSALQPLANVWGDQSVSTGSSTVPLTRPHLRCVRLIRRVSTVLDELRDELDTSGQLNVLHQSPKVTELDRSVRDLNILNSDLDAREAYRAVVNVHALASLKTVVDRYRPQEPEISQAQYRLWTNAGMTEIVRTEIADEAKRAFNLLREFTQTQGEENELYK